MHVARDVLAVDLEMRARGHAQRHMQHGAVFGRVDVVAAEHGVPALLDVGGPGQRHEEAQRLVRDTVLGVVEAEVGCAGGHAVGSRFVAGKEVAQVAA